MGKVVGIDLGTTKCCVAVMEGGVPQVIPNPEGARTTPSIVGFTADGQVLVGEVAKRHASAHPKDTVSAVLRLIGRKFNSPVLQQARRVLPYELVEAPNGDSHVRVGDKVYSPAEILSFVLHKLKAAAEGYLGETVEEAIITVPAYFDDPQRQAIREGGRIAGLKVSCVINGSTAAALTYGLENTGQDDQFVAVCDLGGGTFDITILEMTEGLFQVRATGGDTYLGGEDFDQKIIDWLICEFQMETGIDLTQDRMALQRLKEAAEKAKCELTTAQQTQIVLPCISADASGPKDLNTVLTRPRYEELTDKLLQMTIEPCQKCLADARMKPEQIDEVLLVGGQTRAPNVREAIRRVFGRAPKRAAHDGVVAMGAAIRAGITEGEVKDLVLLDVTPHTLGIETKDGMFTPLVERNSTIPTRKGRVFTTVADNQTRVEVHVLQGESDMAAYNRSLARFELSGILPAPGGEAQIEVCVEIDVNGTISVSAQDLALGPLRQIVIDPSSGTDLAGTASTSVSSEATGLVLVQVVPHTLGVETAGGSFTPLIARNSRLPIRRTGVFTTDADNETRIEVHVLQGESDMAAYNRSLARLELVELAPQPKGVPRIEITVEVDLYGVISVSARDWATDRVASTVIPRSEGVMSLPGLESTPAARASRADGAGIPLVELGADVSDLSMEDDGSLVSDGLPRPGGTARTAPLGEVPMTEDEAILYYLSEDERQQIEKVTAVQKIYRLNTAEKLITALKGTREERAILIRDPNPLVAMCVLGSPRITEAEIESFSAMKNVSDQVLRGIGNHREWTKRYTVINNLVRNPRTPIGVALNLGRRLSLRDIKEISGDGSLPEALRKRAHEAETHWSESEATVRAVVVRRQLDGLMANTVRSVQALEGKLSADEQHRIFEAIEAAKKIKALPDATLDDLRDALKEMEKAAAIIGQAMLRP